MMLALTCASLPASASAAGFLMIALLLTAFPAAAQTSDDPFAAPGSNGEDGENEPPGLSNALDKSELEVYVRHLYAWGPEIEVEVGDPRPSELKGLLKVELTATFKMRKQSREFLLSRDGKYVLETNTYEIAKSPYTKILEKLSTIDQPAYGKEGAPVVIVSFGDFQCPYCAKEAQLLRTQIPQAYPEQVRVYYKDFPLPNHKWALPAAIIGRCLYQAEPEVFWKYHDWIYEHQKEMTPENLSAKVTEFLADKGVDSIRLGRCVEDPKTAEFIKLSREEGSSVGVTSTPTFFVNGRKLSGTVQWAQLKRVIDNEIEYQKIAGDAGDDCGCEVSIPFPASP